MKQRSSHPLTCSPQMPAMTRGSFRPELEAQISVWVCHVSSRDPVPEPLLLPPTLGSTARWSRKHSWESDAGPLVCAAGVPAVV